MKAAKIRIAFAEDIEAHRKRIVTTINATKNFEISIIAVNGRDLILQLIRNSKKLPTLILMDMQMPNCDGLLCTIICKWLFPNVKIVGLSAHTDGIVVGEFLAEGGDGFLSKLILGTALSNNVYKDDYIFEKAITQLLNESNSFIDKLLDDTGENYKNRLSTTQIIAKNHIDLKDYEIIYLQLNAAGFNRLEIAELMNKSESAIQKYFNQLSKRFNVESHNDLNNVAINLGIVKLVRIYQPPTPLYFD